MINKSKKFFSGCASFQYCITTVIFNKINVPAKFTVSCAFQMIFLFLNSLARSNFHF